LAGTHDARWQLIAGACCAGPWLALWAVHAPCVSDLAHLELVAGSSALHALQGGLRRARPALLLARGGFALVEVALSIVALTAPRLALGFGVGASVWVFAITQLAAALASLLRSAWLAWLCQRGS
jgi:hypothetical protein